MKTLTLSLAALLALATVSEAGCRGGFLAHVFHRGVSCQTQQAAYSSAPSCGPQGCTPAYQQYAPPPTYRYVMPQGVGCPGGVCPVR